jgi:14-3-3 protein epsilon
MLGDYYRYMSEFSLDSQLKTVSNHAQEFYDTANEHSNQLPTTHPIRLGLALNFSVFY